MVFFVPWFDVLVKLAKELLGFISTHKAVKESSLNKVKSSGFHTLKEM